MMYTRGEYRDKSDAFGVIMSHSKHECTIVFVKSGQVASAFKHDETGDYSFLNSKARGMYDIIKSGLSGCKAKNGQPLPFPLGTSVCHEFTKSKSEYSLELFNGEVVGANIATVNDEHIQLEYTNENLIPENIPYIKLTSSKKNEEPDETDVKAEDDVIVRSVAEIALEKEDVSWLKYKSYYVVNDDAQAEDIFSFLDNYNGPISYDTETTGLKINCFSKINSPYKARLEQYNLEHPDEQLRADRLVGIIFCVEENVSYYFPCFNRKFKNLYESDTETRRNIINNIKARYMIGEYATKQSDMADYIRNTPSEQWGSDVILMERVRKILETKHIVAHNGAFEWKTGWIYEIDTHLCDDTMIMHQIMYKFRSTTSNRGEPSNLKYLAKVEFGIEQWELGDFFPDFKEDNSGLVRANSKSRAKKKGNSKIDFSYMTYEGTRIYAPTDGDVTLMLFKKYKTDMIKNHREQEYIYNVEVIVACAIGYMEFYGHRIDEEKIYGVRDQTKAEIACIESEIRQTVGFAFNDEIEAYKQLKDCMAKFDEADKGGDKEARESANNATLEATANLYKVISENKEHELNLASPSQVSELFYDVLGYPIQGDKKSVAKKQIKPLLKAKNEDGTLTYPVVKMYSDYKVKDTLMTKFFDNLPYYMYPGGLIFSSFGQISTATGRMSCSRPNAQQYPKAVTKIVVPREGYVMSDSDYSQIEYRVLTALAGNTELAELFSDPDSDYHTLMASMMYGVDYAAVDPKMRSDAKSFNFGIPYGMGFASLAILLTGNRKPSSIEEAKEKYEKYFENQPRTRKFFDQVKEMAQVNKYTKTFWNRYRYYSFTDADGNVNNARKAAALRQAGNAIIQGTAADIFKISVARNFMYIRENGLLGELLIINMVHDEQLFEINAQKLNTQRIVTDIGKNMQFKVEGFPPLYIGSGVGRAWGQAKGKMAEIHPLLLDKLTEESENIPIWRTETTPVPEEDVYNYFDQRVYEFRTQKVIDYLIDSNNYGKVLHPAIGNLLNLQFTYGHDKDKEGLTDDEFTQICLSEFIKAHNLGDIKPELFVGNKTPNDSTKVNDEDEDDVDYEDSEDEDSDEDDFDVGTFTVIDESDVMYGSSLQDLIAQFHYFVSVDMGVCCIDSLNLPYGKKDELVDFLFEHLCDREDEGAMEIIFLQDGNILNRTGVFVNNLYSSDVESQLNKLIVD